LELFANPDNSGQAMLFCALAVHFIILFFSHYVANCQLCGFLHLPLTDGTIFSWELQVVFLSCRKPALAKRCTQKTIAATLDG
jgi:hypothetical protein